jgi:hypothetical protein
MHDIPDMIFNTLQLYDLGDPYNCLIEFILLINESINTKNIVPKFIKWTSVELLTLIKNLGICKNHLQFYTFSLKKQQQILIFIIYHLKIVFSF